MTKVYYARWNHIFMSQLKVYVNLYHEFNESERWSENYYGFYSKGFIYADFGIIYQKIINWMDGQSGREQSMILFLTEGTYND